MSKWILKKHKTLLSAVIYILEKLCGDKHYLFIFDKTNIICFINLLQFGY